MIRFLIFLCSTTEKSKLTIGIYFLNFRQDIVGICGLKFTLNLTAFPLQQTCSHTYSERVTFSRMGKFHSVETMRGIKSKPSITISRLNMNEYHQMMLRVEER